MHIGSASFLAVCAVALSVSGALAETLTQAFASAYSNNPEINAARAQTRAVDENVPLAKSGNRPIISGFASITGQYDRTKDEFGTFEETRADGSVGVTVQQNIFRGFRTKNEIREADANVLASRFGLFNTVQNVLFDAAESYMNVLRDEALLDLRRRNVTFLQEQLSAAEERFNVGENTRTDVAQTRARLAEAQSEVSLAIANLNSSRATYRQVVGNEPRQLRPGFSFGRLLPSSLSRALDVAQDDHPAILSAIYTADAAAFEVKQIEGEYLPTITLEGDARRTVGIGNPDETNLASITGRLTVPIYQGGAVAARVRQAKEILGQRRIEVDLTRDQVRAAAVAAWGQVEAGIASIAAATSQVEAANIALAGVQEEQSVGQRTTLDVLNAQQELLNARVNLVIAQRNRVVAAFSLLSAIGRLNEVSLSLPVARYNPEEHYQEVKDKWFGLRTPDGR